MNLGCTNALRTLSICVALTGLASAEVTVTQSGATLKIKGNAQNDEIALDGAGALGEVTVESGAFPVTLFIGVRNVQINSGDGDDVVNVSSVQIGGSLKVKMGKGSSLFRLDDVGPAIQAPVLIAGALDVRLGGQADDEVEFDVEADLGIVIGGNVTIRQAATVILDADGQNMTTEGPDIVIGGKLRILSNTASPDIGLKFILDNVNVGGTTRLDLSVNGDRVDISACHFTRAVEAKLGADDDVVDFLGADSKFAVGFALNGGAGVDTMTGAGSVIFTAAPKLKQVEVAP
jgi:hypothetical protein